MKRPEVYQTLLREPYRDAIVYYHQSIHILLPSLHIQVK
jgi:hypothetical protein